MSNITKYGKENITAACDKNKAISAALLKLSLAYPAQSRSFSPEEVRALTMLWNEAFEDIEPDMLHEAVRRFIAEDRKGFFPSPGQIRGIVEDTAKNNYVEKLIMAAAMRSMANISVISKRILRLSFASL